MHSRLVRDGVELSYRSLGDGPEAVVLVHGWMVSGAVYDDLVEAFAEVPSGRYKLVIPDLRGTGRSSKPEGGYTLAAFVDDVLAVADAAGVHSFAVVGHSMGGQIALGLAAKAPERVRGALLLCPVPPSGMGLPDQARALFRGSGQNQHAQGTILDMACKELSEPARARLLEDAGTIPASCIAEVFDAWTAGDFVDQLGGIRAPTLVVGTEDPFLPPELLRREIVARVPKADLAYLEGAGHYVQVERPRETAAVLRAFLAGLGG
ncbi:alpha/beta fold hydrolase [Chondromyces apiculatus]|uniref:Hydrolase (HAD superfamily) n=1 Tax=Chondromyces apiculatus DSM 436 TaxID=1192034 RepID=A0A017TB13_9BACT|nr:alpha/beta fold hydrolase [Chondromyces apiculatus]EYF05816.1 Hydrolase (HAD superfamily) [Chondromyces apiculatus DSM 436]